MDERRGRKRRKQAPIKSFGLAIRDNNNDCYLLVQRRDSYGYIDCIDNFWLQNPTSDLSATLATITEEEKEKLITLEWKALWLDCMGDRRWKESEQCRARFEWFQIRETIATMAERGHKFNPENQWGLPKGRRNRHETPIECALREVREETGIVSSQLAIQEDSRFTVSHVGTNGKHYESTFFGATYTGEPTSVSSTTSHEIRRIEWCSLDECAKRLSQSIYHGLRSTR